MRQTLRGLDDPLSVKIDGADIEITLENEKAFMVELTKYDKELEVCTDPATGDPLCDATTGAVLTKEIPLADAEFSMKIEDDDTGDILFEGTELTTDVMGKYLSDIIQVDGDFTITLKETKTVKGYWLDPCTYTIKVKVDNKKILECRTWRKIEGDSSGYEPEVFNGMRDFDVTFDNAKREIYITFYNEKNAYQIEILKTSNRPDASGNPVYLEGIKFKTKVSNDWDIGVSPDYNNTINDSGDYHETITTDVNGHAETSTPSYRLMGSVCVNIQESKGIEGYKLNNTVEKIILHEDLELRSSESCK